MGSEYCLINETAGQEFLVMGGRSFGALENFMASRKAECGQIRLLEDYEYIGGDDHVPAPVRLNGIIVASDAEKLIDVLSKVNPELRIGAFNAAEWKNIFERLKQWAFANPDNAFHPQFYQ